jgi:protein-tyrosine phosphatase
MAQEEPVRVLFVCLGNICRSPTAGGIFRHLVDKAGLNDQFVIDSAGTGAWHAGEPPDRRSAMEALKHGIDLSGQRARKVTDADFHEFDYILAMDDQNYRDLIEHCPPKLEHKISLMLKHGPFKGATAVPDPYYNADGFDLVFNLLKDACMGLLDEIVEAHFPEHAK